MTSDSKKNFPIPENLNNLKFSSNFQYRNYLTKNGSNIIDINNNNFYFDQQSKCTYTNEETHKSSNSPFLFNKNNLTTKPYGYSDSDLKSNFINKRTTQYAHDDFRIHNGLEHLYNINNVINNNNNYTIF